jgi:hypothetical protein
MFGQPSVNAVLNAELVPGVLSIETATVHASYAWASARERLASSAVGRGLTAESQPATARPNTTTLMSDLVVFRVNMLLLHKLFAVHPHGSRAATAPLAQQS